MRASSLYLIFLCADRRDRFLLLNLTGVDEKVLFCLQYHERSLDLTPPGHRTHTQRTVGAQARKLGAPNQHRGTVETHRKNDVVAQ
jgi:hypothetical protein